MPLYDLQCKKCQAVYPDVVLKKYYKTVTRSMAERCIVCSGMKFETMAPLTAMQPDNMWSGQNTQFGYFTSKSQYEQTLKDRNLVTIDKKELDSTRKKVYNTKQDNKKKRQKATHNFVAKELASVEISPDGTTEKERINYVRKREQRT